MHDFLLAPGGWVERNSNLFQRSSWRQMEPGNLKCFLAKREELAQTLQVSSGQIGGRGPKEAKGVI